MRRIRNARVPPRPLRFPIVAASEHLVVPTDRGLYCAAGDFFIDPWRPVDRAVVTHAHSDHATPGCGRYLCSAIGVEVLRPRVHPGAFIQGARYGQPVSVSGVRVSLHPAGHLLGSAQVRVEHAGRVEVITGDYKVAPDLTCDAFEPVPCHRLITESTFGLPIYRWRPEAELAAEMNAWWAGNIAAGRTSVVFAYALGKAQRVLSLLDRSLGPVVVHGSVKRFVEVYEAAGVDLPDCEKSTPESRKEAKGRGLVVAPPSVQGTAWLKKFAPMSQSFASGWMLVRGNRRRRGVDRGFVVSDHTDWPGLLQTIEATGCESVGVTHGYCEPVVRHLHEQGMNADVVPTRYTGEPEEEPASPGEDADGDDGAAMVTADLGELAAAEPWAVPLDDDAAAAPPTKAAQR